MKLIIQIPCYNEESTLPVTLADLPHEIPGIDCIETLVIDDGSTDHTVDVARQHGVTHIIRFTQNRGLAQAFAAGLDAAVQAGADIIVNTDADNQYYGPDIAALVAPILCGEADMVIGDRQTDSIAHFSWTKKQLQKLGSWVVRKVSRTTVPDAPSGFRAYSREAALRLNIMSGFSYVLETIIQAAEKDLKITSVPVRTNPVLRKSRLVRSLPNYIRRQTETILRIYAMYEPLRIFSLIGGIGVFAGVLVALRFLYYYMIGNGGGHVQSLIASAMLIMVGFLVLLGGLLADLNAANRKLLEELLYRVKKAESSKRHDES